MSLKKLLKNRIVAGASIGVLITLFCVVLNFAGVFGGLHLKFADTLYTRNEPSDEIVIIAIDEESTKPDGLGRFTRWSRENYTNLLDKLGNAGVIAFDILFVNPTEHVPVTDIRKFRREVEKSTSNMEKLQAYEKFIKDNSDPMGHKTDYAFAAKLGEFDNIVLAGTEDRIYPLFSQKTILGDNLATPDGDGVFRKFEIGESDNFAFAIVKKYLEQENLTLPLDEKGRFMVNYFGDPYSFRMVPFVSVLEDEFEPNFFQDKIVLVGLTTFREIDDTNLTPRSNNIPMPGVEIWANTIQTILDGKFLVNQSLPSQVLTVFVISATLTIILNFSGIALSAVIALFAIILYLLAAHFFYYRGVILNMVYPFLAIVLSYLSAWVYRYFIADREKQEIKSAFSHYVSDELVKEIAKNPEMVKLGGEKLPVTVFFSDIKGSTTLSEQTEITAWVEQINEYFTAMEEILKNNGGTLDKYEGDAIMAFWNAPIRQQDHVLRAFKTALEMKEKLKQLNEKWKAEGRPELEIRIGIYSGEALVGNFGSENRFDYTVMGNTPNTASRLESYACKKYEVGISVAGFENYANPSDLAKFQLRELDTILLPGKNTPIKIYELS